MSSSLAPVTLESKRLPRSSSLGALVGAFAFHGVCLLAMVWLELWAEARPAPSLPDALLARIPYTPAVDRWNYALWTAGFLPVALLFFRRDRALFQRYVIAGGWVALLRGLCIAATGLGPVMGPDVHAGLSEAVRSHAFVQLVLPLSGFLHFENPLYLTKDLFFSGHTSSTFLLVLYVWRFRSLRWWMLGAHVLVVASVFLSHLHYTIDVVGAWAVTFAVYVVMEGELGRLMNGRRGAG